MPAEKSLASAKASVPRKRNRKRKRRVASESSSSSSDTDSSSDESTRPAVLKLTKNKPTPKVRLPQPGSSSSSSSSSSESDSESASEGEDERAAVNDDVEMSGVELGITSDPPAKRKVRRRTPSPSPPPASIKPFLPPKGTTDAEGQEQELKDRFRKFWMASIADGFRDDLEQIRKESNMNPSRLGMLIDSLASGADAFSSQEDGDKINEMEVVLGGSSSG